MVLPMTVRLASYQRKASGLSESGPSKRMGSTSKNGVLITDDRRAPGAGRQLWSRRSSFQERNRLCCSPLGPAPCADPSQKMRSVNTQARSSTCAAQYRASPCLAGPARHRIQGPIRRLYSAVGCPGRSSPSVSKDGGASIQAVPIMLRSRTGVSGRSVVWIGVWSAGRSAYCTATSRVRSTLRGGGVRHRLWCCRRALEGRSSCRRR